MANVSAFTGAFPVIPGGTVELGYSTGTHGTVTISATSQGAATELVSTTVVTDGSPLSVEFDAPFDHVAGEGIQFGIWVDNVFFANFRAGPLANLAAGEAFRYGVSYRERITLSAGSKVISIRWWRWSGSTLSSRVTSNSALRVSKIVNQNDGLKPFWTPPVVTQLPSQATEGDQVIYAADATNGVYWNLYYDGLGTYPWKFVGGSAMGSAVTASQTTSSTSYTDLATVGPSFTTVLPGDYSFEMQALMENNTNSSWSSITLSNNGSSVGTEFYARMAAASTTVPASWTTTTTMTTAGHVAKMMYRSITSGTSLFLNRAMYVTPIRVSA